MLRDDLDKLLVRPLKKALGEDLVSLTLFGSALDHLEDEETPLLADFNVLAVLRAVDLASAGRLRKPLAHRDLERVRLVILGEGELPRLAEVFPLETRDMARRREVLHGPDPLEGVVVTGAGLLHQVRLELATRRQQLLALCVTHGPTEDPVGRQARSMTGALRTLARPLLELRGVEVGPRLEDLLAALAAAAGLDEVEQEALRDLQATREDRRRPAHREKGILVRALASGWQKVLDLALATEAVPEVVPEAVGGDGEAPPGDEEQARLPFD